MTSVKSRSHFYWPSREQAERTERLAEAIQQAISQFFRTEAAGNKPLDDALNALSEVFVSLIAGSVRRADVAPMIRAFARNLSERILRKQERQKQIVEGKGWDRYLLKEESLAPVRIDRAALHELAVRFAEQEFSRKGEISPTWIIACGKTLVWLVMPWESREEKLLMVPIIEAEMHRRGAHAYSMVTETWTSGPAESGSESLPPRMMPPDKRDNTMFVSTFDRKGGISDSHWLVTIRRNGPNFLGPRIDDDAEDGPNGGGGLMWNLLAKQHC